MELTKNISNQNTETKITAHKPTHRHTQLIFPYITYTRARAHTHCAHTHTHTRAGNTHVRIGRGTHEQDAHAHAHARMRTHTHNSILVGQTEQVRSLRGVLDVV